MTNVVAVLMDSHSKVVKFDQQSRCIFTFVRAYSNQIFEHPLPTLGIPVAIKWA